MAKYQNSMKAYFLKYFRVWWVPIKVYLLPFFLFLVGIVLQRDMIINIFLVLFLVNVLGNLISSVVQIFIGKWYYSLLQILVSCFLFFCVSWIFTFSPPDYYGVYKEIPKNIEIDEPMSMDSEPKDKDWGKFSLVLGSSFQPGIYIYFTNYKVKETGYFYIKAFEITSNDPLSEHEIQEVSRVEVDNSKPKIYSGRFFIHEGSWGDKYAARIELWFEPSNGKESYKITERNYVVEGWMR